MHDNSQLTVKQAAQRILEEISIDRSELRILQAHQLQTNRIGLILKENDPIALADLAELKQLAKRRANGEPIAYIIGKKEFYSREFLVTPDTLIPRPETEELVERALHLMANRSHHQLLTKVLDLGCGTGAIGITLNLENPLLEVTSLDISTPALAVAQANAVKLNAGPMAWIQSDGFSALLTSDETYAGAFDLIISNPPYIALKDHHLDQGDLRFEPKQALTDGGDGLAFYRMIAQQGQHFLRPGGHILVEHGFDQQRDIMELFELAGFKEISGFRDLSENPRMVQATKPCHATTTP